MTIILPSKQAILSLVFAINISHNPSLVRSFQHGYHNHLQHHRSNVPRSFIRQLTTTTNPTQRRLRPSFPATTTSTSINAATSTSDFRIETSPNDDSSISSMARFMIDAFWLQSPSLPISSSSITDSAKAKLLTTQDDDLRERYGERLGKRSLSSNILVARHTEDDRLLGMVTINMALLSTSSLDDGTETNDIFSMEESEQTIRRAMSTIGPKQRRLYKDASVSTIVDGLLGPDAENNDGSQLGVIAVLSNLCVSPDARRMGLGVALCRAVEDVVKEEWGFDKVHLKVEAANEAARGLYEGRLGYGQVGAADREAVGLRADPIEGVFEEYPTEMLILAKDV